MMVTITPEQYIESNQKYFERGGYFEDEIGRHEDKFGLMAQVFSTYESRRSRDEPQPYSRGINAFQLLFDGERWYIANVMWEYERPDVNPIPEEYQRKDVAKSN